MKSVDDMALVCTAIDRAARTAEIAWPPDRRGPVPLERIIGAFNLVHEEVPCLTRAAVGVRLMREGIERPDLLADTTTPLAGFLFANDKGGFIFISKDDMVVRRRFSAAHELGHYLMHFQPEEDGFILGDAAEAIVEGEEVQDAAMERQANRFAAELLMPAETCRHLADECAERYGRCGRYLERRLAGELLVSREAARWRMHSLRLETPAMSR